MCAIWFSLGHQALPESVIDSVRHRGPDGRGWKEFTSDSGPVVMAHRRLAIVDLNESAGQPMSDAKARFWITYNGEIYNFQEVRAQLMLRGHVFTTHGDTEVILKSYIEWGPSCLDRFNGMFAFVIWDNQEKSYFVARDRLGVKPLMLWRHGSRLAIASEVKQFTHVPGFQAAIDPTALGIFAAGSYITDELTFFAGVRSLKPGHFIRLRDGHEETRQWYDAAAKSRDVSNPVEQYRAYLFDSVKQRLVSDVPVGALLSGGLDSSSIVCVLDRLLKNTPQHDKILTFTSWSQDPAVNEKEYSDAVIERTGFRNQLAEITETDLSQTLDSMIFHQEEPFLSSSLHSEWNIYKTVWQQTNLKVVLDGQGSDELTCGYLYLLPILFRSWLETGNWKKFLKEFYYTPRHDLRANVKAGHMLRGLARAFLQPAGRNENPYREFTLSLIKNSIEPQLRWQDRSSMAFGVESRHPFLDYRLVEFLLTLSDSLKFNHGYTKAILRDSLEGILPDKIRLRRTKLGFPSPERRLIASLDPVGLRKNAHAGALIIADVLGIDERADLEMALASGEDTRLVWKNYSLGRWASMFSV